MKTVILKCFLKNIIYSVGSIDSNDSNEKMSTKEIQMKKIKCINLYLKKHKQIAINTETSENFVFQAQKGPSSNIRTLLFRKT